METYEDIESIKRGNRVSWKLDMPGAVRKFGRVVRRTTQDYKPAFAVREDGTGIARVIPARFITKEVG